MILPQKMGNCINIFGGDNNGTGKRLNRTRHAIVVPYRDRQKHLSVFRKHMSDYLKSNLNVRGADFDVWIVEQDDNGPFNRGWLTNIGIAEAIKHSPQVECIILHDVDLVPDTELGHTVPYDKCEWPTRLGNELEHFDFTVPYSTCFGGVSSISRKHWMQINGMSNLYFGWGGEDDDLYERVRQNNLLMGERIWNKNVTKGVLKVPPHGYGVFRVIDESEESHPIQRNRTEEAEAFVQTRALKLMKEDSEIWLYDGLSTLSYLLMEQTTVSDSDERHIVDTEPLKYDHPGHLNATNSSDHRQHPVHLESPEDLPGFTSYHHIYARWDHTKDEITTKSLFLERSPSNGRKQKGRRKKERKHEKDVKQKKKGLVPERPTAVTTQLEFLHIPKTAGSAIEKVAAKAGIRWGACHFHHAEENEMGCPLPYDWQDKVRIDNKMSPKLRKSSPWHLPIDFLDAEYNPYIGKATFTVVRNPYERAISMYYDKWIGYKGVSDKNNPVRINSFLQQLLAGAAIDMNSVVTMPQYHFANNTNHVLHYENLDIEFPALMEKYGLADTVHWDTSKYNQSKDKKFTLAKLTSETLHVIETEYAMDFELFGYSRLERT